MERICSIRDGSGTTYFIPPPIDAQLGRIPTVHASAIAANHLNVRIIAVMNFLHSPGNMANNMVAAVIPPPDERTRR